MKLIFENWRRYLNEELLVEVSYDSSMETLKKASRKAVSGFLYDKGKKMPSDYNPFEKPNRFPDGRERKQKWRKNQWATLQGELINNINSIIVAADINEKQMAAANLWMARIIRKSPEDLDQLLVMGKHANAYNALMKTRASLEKFFHWQRFMPERDLNKIKSTWDLNNMVEGESDEIEAYQEKRLYADADEGTEILREDYEWKIAIMHNKGAACELGKGTDWCTAAPGLDFFKQYYKPDDPLFYFEDRYGGDLVDPSLAEKYQFHYGSGQFMDEEDSAIDIRFLLDLHKLLVSALGERVYDYPKVKEATTRLQRLEDKHGLSELSRMSSADFWTETNNETYV